MPLPVRRRSSWLLRLADARLFLWSAIFTSLLIAFLYVYAGLTIFGPNSGTVKWSGWTGEIRNRAYTVTTVDASGPAAGKLQVGDRILAINGDRRAERVGLFFYWPFLKGGDAYTVRVKRAGAEFAYQMTLRQLETKVPFFPNGGYFLLGLAFAAWAALVALVRPRDRLLNHLAFYAAALVSLRLVAMALAPYYSFGTPGTTAASVVTLQDLGTALKTPATAAQVLLGQALWLGFPWFWPLGFHFFYRFVGPKSKTRLWAGTEILLCVWGAILCAGVLLTNCSFFLFSLLHGSMAAGRERAIELWFRHSPQMEILDSLNRSSFPVYQWLAALATFALLGFGYRRSRVAQVRQRVPWIILGCAIGFGPMLAYATVYLFLNMLGLGAVTLNRAWTFALNFTDMTLLAVPLTLGYAVLTHRVLAVNVVLRRGAQALLARTSLQIILFFPLLALSITILRNPHTSFSDLALRHSLAVNIAFVIAIVAGLKYRRRLTIWIDRKFFREAYDQEVILRSLIEKIRDLDSLAELSDAVSTELNAALHPASLHFLFRDHKTADLVLTKSSDHDLRPFRITDNSRIVQRARDITKPYPLSALSDESLREADDRLLANLQVDLIVPIRDSRHLLAGLLFLGERRSEEPYTKTDCLLLQAVAGQIGLAFDNLTLQARIDREREIRHTVLAHLDTRTAHVLMECPACGRCFDGEQQQCPVDRSELIITLPVDRIIEDRYRLDRRIGEGGTGAVYESMDLRLERAVAVKVLVGELFGNQQAARRFKREAHASAKLNHPNIVPVYDYGTLGQEGAFIVMERVFGVTWRTEIERRRPSGLSFSVEWFTQLLAAVNTAHSMGIVHRDLKPENVLIVTNAERADLVKVLDFGLAKMSTYELPMTASITVPGTIIGTAGYMSPEQLMGRESDERSDIFSIGVMAFEVIRGELPFRGRTYSELLNSMMSNRPSLRGDRVEMRNLDTIIGMCLAQEPSERFQGIGDLEAELIPALRVYAPTAELFQEPSGDSMNPRTTQNIKRAGA